MARRGTAASIDLGELEKLASMQCTDEEIAGWFGVSTRTIERRRKSRVFAETLERGKSKGRISLRRAQLKMLEDGSASMGIWLGKNYLGQGDELKINANGQVPIVLVIPQCMSPKDMPTASPTCLLPRTQHDRLIENSIYTSNPHAVVRVIGSKGDS
jgi:hypothetical protein